jgi:hypothetical protein
MLVSRFQQMLSDENAMIPIDAVLFPDPLPGARTNPVRGINVTRIARLAAAQASAGMMSDRIFVVLFPHPCLFVE